jgi:exopolysaccharide biosynthesis protein
MEEEAKEEIEDNGAEEAETGASALPDATNGGNVQTEDAESGILETEAPVIDASSYKDDSISIEIWEERAYDTDIYLAEIEVGSVGLLKTAFAKDSYGKNVKAATSDIASSKNAIFAINGDYYGFRDEGHVLRNGVSYRETGDGEALVMDFSGGFTIANETEIGEDLLKNAWQIWSFGPALVLEGNVAVPENAEISGRASSSNPRTAIGEISPLHYIAIVSDGRNGISKGLSLHELASVLKTFGCKTAYNLDGGGSSTMWFNGRVVNNPTDGRRSGERSVSDIIYVGHE